MSGQPVKRLDYIDNLRWVMIVLVVGMHAAVTYSNNGFWYYNAHTKPDFATNMFFMAFQTGLQSFFMGFMFMLAGYFVPTAYDKKGFGRFLGDRLYRLGLPTLLYVFGIHIGMGYLLLHWNGQTPFFTAYLGYLTGMYWVDGTGPMWFAVALLAFTLVYAVLRLLTSRTPKPRAPQSVPFWAIIALGLAMGAGTFLVRQVAPGGTAWHVMQFGNFTQYIALFAVGIMARRRGWFETLPSKWGVPVLLTALVGAPVVLFALALYTMGLHVPRELFATGINPWAATLAFYEQIFCVMFCTGLLIVFRDWFNGRNKLAGFFADNGFAVYVIHPPVLVATSLVLQPLNWPPFEMFVVAWVIATLASFVLGALLRQLPVLKQIL